MQNSENLKIENSTVLFIDYKPAELKSGKDWIIVYYAKNPVNSKLERIRLRVPVMKFNTERLNHSVTHVTTILSASEIEKIYRNRLRSRMRNLFQPNYLR